MTPRWIEAFGNVAIEALGLQVTLTQTVMSSLADKQRLAGDCLALEKS